MRSAPSKTQEIDVFSNRRWLQKSLQRAVKGTEFTDYLYLYFTVCLMSFEKDRSIFFFCEIAKKKNKKNRLS